MEAVHSKYKHNQKKKNKKSKVTLDHDTPEKEKLLGDIHDVTGTLTDLQITIEEGASCSRSECVDNVESEISEAFKDVSDAKSSEEDSVGHSSCKEAVPDMGWIESPDCVEDLVEDDIQRCLQDNKKKEKKRYAVETELDEMQALSLLQNQDDEEEILAVTNFESNSTEVDVHVSANERDIELNFEHGCEALHETNVVYEVINEQPSAPVMETVHSVNVRHRKEIKEKAETRNPSDETHLTLLQNLFWACQKEDEAHSNVRPFTEAQLLSLYRNEELKCMQNCISEFLNNELRGDQVLCSRLYDMLVKYLRARGKLTVNNSELDILKSECKEYQHQLWSFQSVTVTESGECQDGNPVSATHEYKMSKYNQAAASKLSHGLSAIKELVNESYSLNAYTCEALKLQIDSYVQTIVLDFAFLPQNARVSIGEESLPAYGSHTGQDLRQVIAELRVAISVLFAFQRRRIKDEGFVTHTRQWLTKLVAVFLRVATWSDHVYLLNHILRCPAGVGKWAAALIQPPPPPFNCTYSSMHLDHMVTTVAVLLKPVAERDQFLSQWNDSTIIEGESLWVIVDSDGEDEQEDLATNDVASRNVLRESDIVDMFNQIPFDDIFRHVLGVRQRDNVDIHETTTLDESQILRLFAFSTVLVNILETGLTTYKGSRYKQFSKRLGRLVRHTIQYATDQFQTFWVVCVESRREQERDMAMLERLQVEYDELLFRAVRCLHNSPGRVAWQFLAVLPFSHASLKTLWQLFFYVLQYDVKQQDDGRSEPQESLFIWLTELIDAEIYYLLTTISNMALARSKNDWSFIETATIHLLQIGFLNDTTRDVCSKSARIMLTNLTNKHPMLMSVIIDKLKKSSCGPMCIYLIKELPVILWRPTDDDLTIIADWLLFCSLPSPENLLARYLISHLNWGFCTTNDQMEELFLPWSMHCRVGLLLARAAAMYSSETAQSGSATIADSVKQVSNLASSMVRSQSNEQAFNVWLWQTMLCLHLHLLDQSEAFVWSVMANPVQAFSSLPELESQSEEMELLRGLVKQQESLAALAAILMTTVGHSLPIICADGFTLLEQLQACYRHTAVIFCLQHIVPLFLDYPQSLISNEKFRSLMISLLSADRTYLKMARNLIAPEFPGMVLKQFGDMIQFHLENHHRYSLSSCAPLAQLWLQALCSVWAEEPSSVVYLMDIVLAVAFFRSELKIACSGILSQLLQLSCEELENPEAVSQNRNGANSGRFSSLLNWVSSGTNPAASLMPKASVSCPHAPWFAYFALEVEEYNTQSINGLWPAVLKELSSATGKASVDNAIRRAANSLKIQQIPSSSLAIYRWSQQALDTPVDHPVLPLLWQKFFTLYLARVPIAPGAVDKGSVGEDFFEGMTNLSYQKRIKKKLLNCMQYHLDKIENDTDGKLTTEQKNKSQLLSKLYKTFSLWLEEPRLHEPGLFMPALPPQYNPLLLTAAICGDQSPWVEYVDHESLLKYQQEALTRWSQAQGRAGQAQPTFVTSSNSSQQIEDPNPSQRIIKRLQSYDATAPPPPLRFGPPVVPIVTRHILLHKGVMLDSIQPSLNVLQEFAKSFLMRVSEHMALDCTFLELLPTLFRDVETEVTLHAACDTAEPGTNPRRSHTSASSLVCAGPAEIKIRILEARLNECAEHQMQTNRMEFDGVLRHALQPPPAHLCSSSLFIENLSQALDHEANELSRVGDIELLTKVREVGVALFYNLTCLFAEESTSHYPPIKQLLTTYIESLGRTFISSDESECVQLLNTVLQNHQLTGLLAPHFNPSIAAPSTFIQAYSNLVTVAMSDKASDLTFVLLTKIDLPRWLPSKKPRLCDRTELIQLAMKALSTTGKTPSEDKLMIHEVFRKHLCQLMMFDFPEHYGEVITLTLEQSETQSIAPDVWYELLEALSSYRFRQNMSMTQMKEGLCKFATEQRILTHNELRETVLLLGNHFMKERLQYGLYGLYPKYRDYIDPFCTFLGLVGHGLIASRLLADRGSLGDKLSEQLWPLLESLFSPWLNPYFTRNLSEPTAAWIQQLTDDRSVLPPWIITDVSHANKMACMFTECIRFMLDTLPGCTNILSFVWQFYVIKYAHASVKEHILSLMHSRLLTLPWNRFMPSFQDIDLMLRVVDQFLPDCHAFLGAIFIEVHWYNLVQHITANCSPQAASKAHCALLHLLVKLSNEPNIRQSGKVLPLLLESQQFQWHLIDATSYELVANWFVMSYDPRVILQITDEEWNGIDMAVLELLQVAAGHVGNVNQYHASTPKKRLIFVRASVKLLLSCLSRYKHLIISKISEVKATVRRMVDKIETCFISSPPGPQRVCEAGLILSEFLVLVNQSPSSTISEIAVDATIDWLSSRDCSSVVVAGLLRILGTTVQDEQHFGSIMEAALMAFFRRRVSVSGSTTSKDWWSTAACTMQPVVRHGYTAQGHILVSNGHLLTLYAIVLKMFHREIDIKEEASILNQLLEWINAIKLEPQLEAKTVLLLREAVRLSYEQCSRSEDSTAGITQLTKLVSILNKFAEHKSGTWSLLGAIGIRKQPTISNRFRLICRIISAYILAQLPEVKGMPEPSKSNVRIKEHAPGCISFTNGGEITPNAEALKAVSQLESLVLDKDYIDLKNVCEMGILQIQQPENSLHNAHPVISSIASELYTDAFLHTK